MRPVMGKYHYDDHRNGQPQFDVFRPAAVRRHGLGATEHDVKDGDNRQQE
jgi:hypothetical protein